MGKGSIRTITLVFAIVLVLVGVIAIKNKEQKILNINNETKMAAAPGTKLYDIIKNASKGTATSNGINYATTDGLGVYEELEDGHKIYFYRGNVLDNNVIFAGHCWVMLRTTTTDGVKLVYKGSVKDGQCVYRETIGNIYLSSANAYLGYMFGSTSNYSSYSETTKNTSSSALKQMLDSWYEKNLTDFSSYIEDTVYCNDRSIYSGSGYGRNETLYGAYNRLYLNNKPTYTCPQANDKFTVSSNLGNGALTYPIATLTADEAMFAGAAKLQNVYSYFLYSPDILLSMTPFGYSGFSGQWNYSNYILPYMFAINLRVNSYNESVYPSYQSGLYPKEQGYVKPVISLKNDTSILSGDGSDTNPYVITNIFDVNTSVDGANGSISEGKKSISEGRNYDVLIYPNDGYVVSKFTVNGTDETNKIKNNIYSIKGIDKTYNIVVKFKKDSSFVNSTNEKTLYNIIKKGSLGTDLDNRIYYSNSSYTSNGVNYNGNGIYLLDKTKNDEFPVYFFRGPVENNNVIYANKCWLMYRTTDTGGVKIIYNGEVNDKGECVNTGNNTFIAKSYYNKYVANYAAAYAGYMFGYPGAATYEDEHANINESTVKKVVDAWYKENILNSGYAHMLEDEVYCADRTYADGKVYFTSGGTWSGKVRYSSFSPSLICTNKNDRFTVSSKKGNGKLIYPIGLITMDEALLVGYSGPATNSPLANNEYYWTMTPSYSGLANASTFTLSNWVSDTYRADGYEHGVRPVVTLKNNVSYISGEGTKTKPYIIDKELVKVTTLVNGENGNISSPSNKILVGSDYTITIRPNDGYLIKELLVNNIDETKSIKKTSLEKYEYTIKNITKDTDVKVTFDVDKSGYYGMSLYDRVGSLAASDDKLFILNSNVIQNGVFKRYETENNKYPVYYYRGDVNDNNLIYNGSCWQIVRTTATGGTKIIYNGAARYPLNYITKDDYINVSNDDNYPFTYNETTNIWSNSNNLVNNKTVTMEFSVKEEGEYYLEYLFKYGSSEELEPEVVDFIKNPKAKIYLNDKLILEPTRNPTSQLSLGKLKPNDKIKITIDRYNIKFNFNFSIGIKTNDKLMCKNKDYDKGIADYVPWNMPSFYTYNENGWVSSTYGKGGNAYIGYMYGTPQADSYEEEHANVHDSTIKILIDKWYEENILNKDEERLLEDTTFCNDRNPSAANSWSSNIEKDEKKLGFGKENLYSGYAGNYLYLYWSQGALPNIGCKNKNDIFSVSDKIGNGALKYPIALIEGNEAMYAGAQSYYTVKHFLSGVNMWTLTPMTGSTGSNQLVSILSTGYLSAQSASAGLSIRPVVSLGNRAVIIDGSGVEEDPYIIGESFKVITKVIKGEGKISPSVNFVRSGDSYEVILTPLNGSHVSKFVVNGIDKTNELKDNKYIIKDINEDYLVEVEYAKTFIEELIENPKTGIKDFFLLVSFIVVISLFLKKELLKKSPFRKI